MEIIKKKTLNLQQLTVLKVFQKVPEQNGRECVRYVCIWIEFMDDNLSEEVDYHVFNVFNFFKV
jgi:hypothetical protein